MRRTLSGWPLLLVLGVCSILLLGLLYFISGALIFGGRTASQYDRPQEPVCNDWYQKEVLRDHRSPEVQSASSIRIPTCDQAVAWPRRTEMLSTEEGLRVRLVMPEMPEAQAIWIHVHGITDSYLNGMRFTDLARREGFQLLLLELQNHGGSERHSQGSSWGCREKFDLLAALDYVQKTWPQKPILLSGTSMGTMTITQAALTRPDAFQSVRGIIFESPLSTFANLSERFCGKTGAVCGFVFKKVIPLLTPLRTDTDFHSCFRHPDPPTDIPTELWLSHEEFKTPEHIELASEMPGHRNVKVYIFSKGTHSAYYGYNPDDFENALRTFWQSVNKVSQSNHVP
ncbi:MAG TPA: alpha/beta fold hydrolase [Oligoflexus sp.]|uniref:alpha/beta fold hydrolase n=1 Tax=Oligoflexus sp. TaxID=1971216 RepID=UPI002D4A584F|nr:alpha/beta fold hydrolase [Oligoflexus sp.]HYX32516.1 alpha/beta fold hydrolase [Oligoflexus sp.]